MDAQHQEIAQNEVNEQELVHILEQIPAALFAQLGLDLDGNEWDFPITARNDNSYE